MKIKAHFNSKKMASLLSSFLFVGRSYPATLSVDTDSRIIYVNGHRDKSIEVDFIERYVPQTLTVNCTVFRLQKLQKILSEIPEQPVTLSIYNDQTYFELSGITI